MGGGGGGVLSWFFNAREIWGEHKRGSGWGITNISCQLKLWPFVSYQLNFRPFVSCQLMDY